MYRYTVGTKQKESCDEKRWRGKKVNSFVIVRKSSPKLSQTN